mgnify:CR=1 FL=1
MKFTSILTSILTLSFAIAFAQETTIPQGHTNQNKFRQLYNELATPNAYRTASGAPGPAYYQQQADYVMELTLNDDTQELFGDQTITYTNNSPETLSYLWLQLDQNVRARDGQSFDRLDNGNDYYGTQRAVGPGFVNAYILDEKFDGGFKIDLLQDTNGMELPYTVHQTMMRIDLPTHWRLERLFRSVLNGTTIFPTVSFGMRVLVTNTSLKTITTLIL